MGFLDWLTGKDLPAPCKTCQLRNGCPHAGPDNEDCYWQYSEELPSLSPQTKDQFFDKMEEDK